MEGRKEGLTLHIGPAASPSAPAPSHPHRGPVQVLLNSCRTGDDIDIVCSISSPAPHGAALPALLAPPAADLPPATRVQGRSAPVAVSRAATATAKSFPNYFRAIWAEIARDV